MTTENNTDIDSSDDRGSIFYPNDGVSENPYFSHPERAFSGLFSLLLKATEEIKRGEGGKTCFGYACETPLLEAIDQHVGNAMEGLFSGIQGLGNPCMRLLTARAMTSRKIYTMPHGCSPNWTI